MAADPEWPSADHHLSSHLGIVSRWLSPLSPTPDTTIQDTRCEADGVSTRRCVTNSHMRADMKSRIYTRSTSVSHGQYADELHAGQRELDGGPQQADRGSNVQPRTIRAKPLLLARTVVIAALLFVLAGCMSGSGLSADGPLSSGNSRHGPIPNGSICVPGGRPQTFGDQQFTNFGSTVVVLDRVVLLHPHHERLIGSYAVPGDRLVGAPGNWPPKYPGMPSGWKHRQPVHGFRLAPGRTFNMVLGIAARIPVRATSRGMVVYYHDTSGTYVAKNYFANIIAANTKSC